MKVIEEGKAEWKLWWAGQRMECRECGRVVELENDDAQSVYWIPSPEDRVEILCQRCGSRVRMDREDLKWDAGRAAAS